MPWYPLPGSSDEPPAPLSRALDRFLRDFGSPKAEHVTSVFDRWGEIVGDGLASHATPVSLRDGTLVLSVPDPAWATQLRFLEAELLRLLADALGPDEVRTIEVRVRAPNRRSR